MDMVTTIDTRLQVPLLSSREPENAEDTAVKMNLLYGSNADELYGETHTLNLMTL